MLHERPDLGAEVPGAVYVMLTGVQRLGLAILIAWLVPLGGCERGELLGRLGRDGDAGIPPGGPFGVPALVTAISDPTARDTDPSFTSDLLELYFMSDRNGGKDLWVSRREDAGQPWEAPALVDELNTPGASEENPSVSADGRTLWFYTDRNTAQGTIWRSARSSRQEPWGEPQAVSELTSGDGASDVAVGVAENSLLMALASRPPGSRSYDVYLSERALPEGAFSTPILLDEVNTSSDDFDPDLAQGGLFIILHSNVTGGADLFFSQRTSTAAVFGPPIALEELNSSRDDSAPAISTDRGYVMFSSDRSGNHDIYEARSVAP